MSFQIHGISFVNYVLITLRNKLEATSQNVFLLKNENQTAVIESLFLERI